MIPKDEFEALLQGMGTEGEKETLPRGQGLSRQTAGQQARAAGVFSPRAAFPGEERRQAG